MSLVRNQDQFFVSLGLHPGLPDPPAELNRDKPLDFKLLDREREFLRGRLLDTRRSGDGQSSLLSALVRAVEVIPDGRAP